MQKQTLSLPDFSLTEGENAILPHYRFDRLFAQRRLETSAPYSGGICFTMTPKLNQLSLYMSACSFNDPDADPDRLARSFYRDLFGPDGAALPDYLPLFDVIPDWGNYSSPDITKKEINAGMKSFIDLLESCKTTVSESPDFFPSPEIHRQELLWHGKLFNELSGDNADYEKLCKKYWNRIYRIYDSLPHHVDPRPINATKNLIDYFRQG